MPWSTTKVDVLEPFWKWFQANKSRYETSTPSRFRMRVLHRKLRQIHSGLVFQFGRDQSGWGLEISGDGVVELIPIVQKVVAAAPPVPGWTIYAFRQRCDNFGFIQTSAGNLDVSTMRFEYLPNGRTIDLRVFVSGLTKKDEPRIRSFVYLTLDALVGEYDAITKIETFDLQPMPADCRDLLPLSKLKELLDGIET